MSRSDDRIRRAQAKIEEIRRRLLAFDRICSGTITRRMTTCGTPNCRCKRGERHGPYYQWGRVVKGRLVHRWLSAAEATRFTAAIKDYREIRRLLRAWEHASVTLLEDPDRRKS
jgi:hypothetical protein